MIGPYRLYFVLAPGANEGGALPVGGVVTEVIDRGDLDSYTFAIAAGESYRLRFTDDNATALYPSIVVYDSFGASLCRCPVPNLAVTPKLAAEEAHHVKLAASRSFAESCGSGTGHAIRRRGSSNRTVPSAVGAYRADMW